MRRPASIALCAARFSILTFVIVIGGATVFAQAIEEGTGRLLPAQVAPPQPAPEYSPPASPAPMPYAPLQAAQPTAPDLRVPPTVEEPVRTGARGDDLPVAGQDLAPPPITGSPVLLLLDFRSSTLTRAEVEALTQALWAQLNVSDAVRLLPRHETRQWLIANDLYPYLPYGPVVPMHMVARKSGANFIVTGTIDRVDASYAVELMVYGAADEVPVMKSAGARFADLNQMVQQMGATAGQVIAALEKELGRSLGAARPAARRAASAPPAQREVKAAAEPAKVKVAAAVKKPLVEPDVAIAPPASEKVEMAAIPAKPQPETRVVAKADPMPPQADDVLSRTEQPVAAKPVETPTATPKPVATATPKPVATPKPTPEPMAAKPVVTPEVAPPAERAEPLYQEAMKLPIGDDTRLEKLQQAAALEPKSSVYSQQLGFDYYYRKEYQKCVELCDKALANTPKNSQLLLVKGSALISLKQWEEAVKAYEASIAADPTNNYARYNLALGLEQMKSPKAAAAWQDYLEKAKTDADPQHRDLMADATARLAKLETPAK